jgi:hypothetical protein
MTTTRTADPDTRTTDDSEPARAPSDRVPDPGLRMLVRETLQSAPSYRALSVDDQRSLAKNLTRVVDFLEDRYAGMGPSVAEAARALDRPRDPASPGARAARALDQNQLDKDTSQIRQRAGANEGQVGKDFQAGAVKQGASTFEQGVKSTTVDFVKFVSGLIEGVFTSIVNSSIKQMMAFATYLENVVKSVEEFTAQNVTPNQARDALVNKYPNALQLNGLETGTPTVGMKDDVDEKLQPNFKQDFGVDASLDDEGGEEAIVQGMRLQMGRQRQHLLSQILLMGVNRIVVTEGEIKASVLFSVDATDTANRTNTASMHDEQTHNDSSNSGSFWGTDSSTNVNARVSTVDASDTDTSSAKAELHSKLSGSVTVKFKSDVFPLERFSTDDQKAAVQGKSGGG